MTEAAIAKVFRTTGQGARQAAVAILLVVALCWSGPALAAEAEPAPDSLPLFVPLPTPDAPDLAAATKRWEQSLGPGYEGLAAVYATYEQQPNVQNALAALKHFKALAGDADLRRKAFGSNLSLFLTLDVLKFDITTQAVMRLNDQRRRRGERLIAFSYRVGSSGKRFRDLLAWRRAGGVVADIPVDDAYIASKLSQSDDDVSNEASPQDLAAEPGMNEAVNGRRAAAALAEVTDGLGARVEADDIKVEFLSPTKAYKILRPKIPGYQERWPNFMGAWVVGNEEKYRGLFAEEQLHAWGMQAGHLTDMRKVGGSRDVDILADATTDYADSAKVATMNPELFPLGDTDPAGWMANNVRQATEVHDGSVADLAKYTLRMMEFWKNVKQNPVEELRAVHVGMDEGEFQALKKLADEIRNPKSDADLDAVIGSDAKRAAALEKLKAGNWALLRGGHRAHVAAVQEALKTGLQAHGGAAADGVAAPTVDSMLGGDNAYRRSMETLATAYSNLPDQVIDRLNRDLAEYVRDNQTSDDPEILYGVEVRKMLMSSVERAQTAGARLRREGEGFREINAIVNELKADVDTHLKIISDGVDLDSYVEQIIDGRMKQRRLRLDWSDESGVPRARWVDEQWDPEDVAIDLKRLSRLAHIFGWDSETYAERLHQVLTGDGDPSWPGLAIRALRNLVDIYDPSRIKARYARLTSQTGEEVDLAVVPTGRGDAVANLGVVAFKAALKGGKAVQQGWKLWGDVADARDLSIALVDIFGDKPGQTTQERAQAHALAASKAIALWEYAEHISVYAKQPELFSRWGGTLSTGASLLGSQRFGQEEIEQLTFAAFKDLLLQAQPELALAFVAYDIYAWSAAKLTSYWGTNAFVNLLVHNGDWDLAAPSGVPRLLAVDVNGTAFAVATPEERKTACAKGGDAVGLMRLAKNPALFWKNGVKLKTADGDIVHPREALLDVFYGEGMDGKDQVLKLAARAVKELRRVGLNHNTRSWTNQWLADLGIVSETFDDSRKLAKADVRADGPARPIRIQGQPGEPTITLDPLGSLESGQRKQLGTLVSMYWVRRQALLECQVMDKLIAEAVKRKQDEVVARIDLKDIAREVASLQERMKELDRKVWPAISRATDPFDGPDYTPETDVPIYDDYMAFTKPLHTFLDQAIAYADPDKDVQNPLYVRYYVDQTPDRHTTPINQLDYELAEKARGIVKQLLGFVREYEKSYEAVLKHIDDADAYTKSLNGKGKGISIKPAHLKLKPTVQRQAWRIPQPFPNETEGADNLRGAEGVRLTHGYQDEQSAKFWADNYRRAFDKTRTEFGEVIQTLQKELRPLAEDYPLAEAGDTVAEWWHWWFLSGPYEVAQKHPLWPHALKLSFQLEKLKNIQAGALAEESEETLAAAIGQMRLYQHDTENAKPPGSDGLPALSGKMEDAYGHTLKLASNLADLQVEATPNGPLHVTEKVRFKARVAQQKDLNGPKPEDFRKLVTAYHWEVVPTESAVDRRKGTDCAYYVTGDIYWLAENSKPDKGADATLGATLRKRLTEDGELAVRVTALGAGNVPLARSTTLLKLPVEPARVQGTFEVDGPWNRSQEPVFAYLGRTGVEQSNPRFPLAAAGAFDKPLCSFTRPDMSRDVPKDAPDVDPPGAFPPNPFDIYAGVVKSERRGRGDQTVFITRLDPRSDAVPLTYEKGGVFKLQKPLKLHFAREVSVSVEVTDASGAKVDSATVSVTAGAAAFDGLGPHKLELDKGDRLQAEVEVTVGDVVLKRKSRLLTYDPEKSPKTLTLKVGMPFYDVGNLRLNGAFSGEGGAIVGGEMSVGIASGAQSAAGGVFDVANDRPVLLSEEVSVKAVVWNQEDRLMRPVGGGEFKAKLKVSALPQNIGPIKVTPFDLVVKGVQANVGDWTGRPFDVGDISVRASAPGGAFSQKGAVFEGNAVFRKRSEPVLLNARMNMPVGDPATGEIDVRLADVGSLLEPKAPSTPYDLRLEVYQPGSLQVVGRLEATTRPGAPEPSNAELKIVEGDPSLTNVWSASVGAAFLLDLGNPVRMHRQIIVEAKAQSGADNLRGRAAGLPPTRSLPVGAIAKLDLGVIQLGQGAEQVTIPNLIGMTPEVAQESHGDRFSVIVSQERTKAATDDVAGKIHKQVPAPSGRSGATLPRGAQIIVWANDSWHKAVIPNVADKPIKAAIAIVSGAGLTPQPVKIGPAPPKQKPFVVVEQDPIDEIEVDKGASVTLRYYGLPLIPNVAGETVEAAKGVLAEAGFVGVPKAIGAPPEGEKVDIVVSQRPGADVPSKRGVRIALSHYGEAQEAETPAATPPAGEDEDAVDPFEGPWVGTLRLAELSLDGKRFTSYSGYAAFLKSQMKPVSEEEASEATVMTLGAYAAVSAIGDAIFLIGQSVIDMLFAGAEIGFALEPDGGGYWPYIPGMPQETRQKMKESKQTKLFLQRVDEHTLVWSVKPPPASGATAFVEARFRLAEDLQSIDVTIEGGGLWEAAPDKPPLKARLILRFEGKPGEIDFKQITESMTAKMKARQERIKKEWGPYLAILKPKGGN